MYIFWCTGLTQAVDASAIGQSFQTNDTSLTAGALVSTKTGSSNTVELANQTRNDKLVGIVSTSPLIELADDTKSVQVVMSGVTTAFVSDINGDVKTGDKITSSPIEGVGMKAITSGLIVGSAQADLNTIKTTDRTVTDVSGVPHTVHVGLIPLQVNVTYYAAPGQNASFLPTFLQDFANGIAGKEVSPVRVVVSTVIILLAFVSIAVLLYASVKSSIISIGRNPLSEVSVRKSMLQIGALVVAILLLALITIYLILTT